MIKAKDVITKFNGDYSWVVTEEFIKFRDKFASNLKGDGVIRRADCTAAEYILAEHIEGFELTPSAQWENDVKWITEDAYLDAKQYGKAGVKVSNVPVTNVELGKIHYFPVWKWLPNNWYPGQLEVGKEIQIRLLGLVPAKLAVKNLQDVKGENRFIFPEELNV